MSTDTEAIDALRAGIGVTRGPSSWRTISQQDINNFAGVTGDHQWIHVDQERAQRESPFGTTIAHGNLTLSSIDGLREEISAYDPALTARVALAVNMGWNRVRFPSPVPAGSKIQATAELVSVEEKGGGWWEVVDRFTVTVEGGDKPACVAESVGRLLLKQD